MKRVKTLLLALVILFSLLFAQPSLADRPKFLKNPDYIEVTKNLNELVTIKEEKVKAEESIPEEIQQKIDQLEFQKYTLESGLNWGQCTNETGNNLAIYGPKPDVDDDEDYAYENGLYFLADGQTTKNKWDCDGVYLSSDAKLPSTILEALTPIISEPESVPETSTPEIPKSTSVAKASNSFEKNPSSFSTKPTRFARTTSTEVKSPTSIAKTSTVSTEEKSEKTTGPIAFKILDGTKLVVKTNSTSGELEFNVTPTKVFRSGEVNWFIPNISQADIDAKVSNAKINKIK